MSKISFYELNESEVKGSQNLDPGSFICCKDSANIYMVPNAGGEPIKMAETIRYLTESERSSILAPINGKNYFCYDTKKLWVYYNGWTCLNPDIVSEFNIENVVLTSSGNVEVSDSRITSSNTGEFIPDLSVSDLVSNINVTCITGKATITGITSYDIPGVLKIK